MWTRRDDNHGWDTVLNILDCVAMLCIIWVFDGFRTIHKDKDVGSLMVSCSAIAILINVITTLIETGLFSMAKFIGKWNIGNFYPDLEIAYTFASESFNWLYNIDDCLMVIPYFWCYMLCIKNDVKTQQRRLTLRKSRRHSATTASCWRLHPSCSSSSAFYSWRTSSWDSFMVGEGWLAEK